MPANQIFTNEQWLAVESDDPLNSFWQQGLFSHFIGKNDIRINYCQFNFSGFEKTLVIVPGRVESYLKYKELAYEFHQQQFNVFIVDHRGQGLSQRLLDDKHKGYVDCFEDYVDDLNSFIDNHVIAATTTANKPYLLAHSMGGAISCRYLQSYPEKIQAAVLSSPMIAINSGKTPHSLANVLVSCLDKVNQIFSNNPWYFIGQGDYTETPFSENHLMQSQLRYQIFTQLYQQIPSLKLGGVTLKWLKAAEQVRIKIFKNMPALSTPLIVLQASEDTIVSNSAQDDFCQQLHQQHSQSCTNGKAAVIDGARHELLFEKDCYRKQALTLVLDWFAKH